MIPKFPAKQTKLAGSEFMIVKLAFQLSLWLEYVVRSSCSEVENSEHEKNKTSFKTKIRVALAGQRGFLTAISRFWVFELAISMYSSTFNLLFRWLA